MNDHCHYCKRQLIKNHPLLHRTRDHVVPQRLAGNDIVVCCHQCNNVKGGMTPEQWAKFMINYPQWWNTFLNHGDVVRYQQCQRAKLLKGTPQ